MSLQGVLGRGKGAEGTTCHYMVCWTGPSRHVASSQVVNGSVVEGVLVGSCELAGATVEKLSMLTTYGLAAAHQNAFMLKLKHPSSLGDYNYLVSCATPESMKTWMDSIRATPPASYLVPGTGVF